MMKGFGNLMKYNSFSPFLYKKKEDLHYLCRNCKVCKGHVARKRYIKVKRLTDSVREKYIREFGPIIGESRDLFEGYYLVFLVDLLDPNM